MPITAVRYGKPGRAHKKTGLRCGGRGKSDIFSALQNALINNALKSSKIYTVLAKKCSYSGKIIPAVKKKRPGKNLLLMGVD